MQCWLNLKEKLGKKRGRPNKNIDTFEKLFDICPCTHMSRELCDCPRLQKVPERESSVSLLIKEQKEKCTLQILIKMSLKYGWNGMR